MTYKNEFPDYDYEIKMPEGFWDSSWHNDVCPSIRRDVHHDLGVKIYCDYADWGRRELGNQNQFTVCLEDDHSLDTLTDKGRFDEFDDAVLFANALAAKFKKEKND
jgi:hypothetical protein